MNNEINDNYLIFKVDEKYALGLDSVIKIIEYMPVTPVPEVPAYIPGIINMSGEILPVINMRTRLHKEEKEITERTCIIIVDIDGIHLGLIVDEVLDLNTIPADKMVAPPQVGDNYSHIFVKMIALDEDQVVLILDGNKLISYNDLNLISNMEQEV